MRYVSLSVGSVVWSGMFCEILFPVVGDIIWSGMSCVRYCFRWLVVWCIEFVVFDGVLFVCVEFFSVVFFVWIH